MKKIIFFAAFAALSACSSLENSLGIAAGGPIEVSVQKSESTKGGFTGTSYTSDFQFLIRQKEVEASNSLNYNKTMSYNSTTEIWGTKDASKIDWAKEKTHDFEAYAVAPAMDNASLTGDFTFSVPADQSTDAASLASDLMISKQTTVDANGKIQFLFDHKLTRLRITLTGTNAENVSVLKVGGLKTSVNVNLSAGTCTTIESGYEITAHKDAEGVFEVIVPAQTVDCMYASAFGANGTTRLGAALSLKPFTLAVGNYKNLSLAMTSMAKAYIGPYGGFDGNLYTKSLYKFLIFTDDAVSTPYISMTKNNGYVTRVFFPYATSITSEGLFSSATYLTRVDAPKLQTLGKDIFDGCTSLATVNIPSLETIGDLSFYNTPALTSMSMLKVSSIGTQTFYKSGIQSLDAPLLKSVGVSSFYSSQIKTINTPLLESVGNMAFMYCPISEIAAPKIKTIGDYAFSYSNSGTGGTLVKVDCFANLESIGEYAFSGQPLTTSNAISLPKCTSIGVGAFMYCSDIISFEAPLLPSLANSVLYMNDTAANKLTSVKLQSVTSIGNSNFQYRTNLTYMELGTSTTSDITLGSNWAFAWNKTSICDLVIGPKVLLEQDKVWGGMTFKSITGGLRKTLSYYLSLTFDQRAAMTELTINANEITQANINKYFQNHISTYFPNVRKIIITGTRISDGANFLNGNIDIKTVYSSTLTNITSQYVFANSKITTLDMPNLKYLGAYACSGCTALTSVNLPSWWMDDFDPNSQFNGCTALVKAYLGGSSMIRASNVFNDCSQLTDLAFATTDGFGFYDGSTTEIKSCTAANMLGNRSASYINLYLSNTEYSSRTGVTWKSVNQLSAYPK